MRKQIAILCFTDFTKEPRVLRTIDALRHQYEVILYSDSNTIEGISCHKISHLNINRHEINFHQHYPSSLKRLIDFILAHLFNYKFQSKKYFERMFWSNERKQLLDKLQKENFDLVIGHGIFTLPIISKLGTRCIFNAHEYYLREFEENENWLKYTQPYYLYIFDTYFRNIDLMFCVSDAIQKEYQKFYSIKSVEITNATGFQNLEPNPIGQKIKLIHHGGAIRSRQLEIMAEVMMHLGEEYVLTFMLTPSDIVYLDELKLRYASRQNINFITPVAVDEISTVCNQHDIGIFILPPVNFNWLNALPNKLFEYIQGRLCIAVSPNPDMKRIVEENDLGIVSSDYTAASMAKAILNISRDQLFEFKQHSHRSASYLNGEKTLQIINQEVNRIIN